MTMPRRPLLALAALAFALSACSFSFSAGTANESADKVATVAMDALEEEVGQRPDAFDCGDDDVEIREDNEIDCLLTHQGVEFDATVTINDVDGSDYTVNVQVASTPNTEENPS